MENLSKIQEALMAGKVGEIKEIVQSCLDSRLTPQTIINDGFIPGMAEVGKKFKSMEIWVPEVLMAAKTMQLGMDVLAPLVEKTGGLKKVGKVMLGTVYGDSHDIGKNLVGMMLSGGGYEVVDIGENVSADKFVEDAIKIQPDIIGMSALLSTAIPRIKETVTALRNGQISKPFKTIIGGAAVSQLTADESGADAYASDAAVAVEVINDLMKMISTG